MGGLLNDENGSVYLDSSERFADREAAMSAGRDRKQKAIRNGHEGEELRLDGAKGLTTEQRIAGMRQMFTAPRVVCPEWLDPNADEGDE